MVVVTFSIFRIKVLFCYYEPPAWHDTSIHLFAQSRIYVTKFGVPCTGSVDYLNICACWLFTLPEKTSLNSPCWLTQHSTVCPYLIRQPICTYDDSTFLRYYRSLVFLVGFYFILFFPLVSSHTYNYFSHFSRVPMLSCCFCQCCSKHMTALINSLWHHAFILDCCKAREKL